MDQGEGRLAPGWRRVARALTGSLAVAAFVAFGPASAQEVTIPKLQGEIQQATQNVTPLGATLMGDEVNLYNGSLQFSAVDIDLPGNSPLPVKLMRTYQTGVSDTGTTFSRRGAMADWELDVPYVAGVFPSQLGWVNKESTTARCSKYSAPPPVITSQHTFHPSDYWQGNTVHVPGHGSQEMLKRSATNTSAPSDEFSYPLVTRDHWQIRCLPSLRLGSGEGFVAKSPDGTEYRFDWMANRPERFLKGGRVLMARTEVRLYATLVTDRFGNTVSYSYDNSGRLLSILGSDGRKISLTYAAVSTRRVQSATDGNKTWLYAYGASGDLDRVTLPDRSQWKFNLRGLVYPRPYELGEEATVCGQYGGWPSSSQIGTITHPSGAFGDFEMRYISHPRSNVTKYCINQTGIGNACRTLEDGTQVKLNVGD